MFLKRTLHLFLPWENPRSKTAGAFVAAHGSGGSLQQHLQRLTERAREERLELLREARFADDDDLCHQGCDLDG